MEGYLAVIQALGFNFVPRNWGACAGALIAIGQNSALFSLLGDRFGGDGRVNFGLPELRGRIPMGFGTGPGLPQRNLGQRVGVEDVTLVAGNLPAHTHSHTYVGGGSGTAASVEVAATAGTKDTPDVGDYIAAPANALGAISSKLYLAPNDLAAITPTAQTVPIGGVTGGGGGFDSSKFAIANSGASVPFPIVQPSTVINYCICVQGTYPSRS